MNPLRWIFHNDLIYGWVKMVVQLLGHLISVDWMSVAVVAATVDCLVVTKLPLHSHREVITALTSCPPGPKGFRPAIPAMSPTILVIVEWLTLGCVTAGNLSDFSVANSISTLCSLSQRTLISLSFPIISVSWVSYSWQLVCRSYATFSCPLLTFLRLCSSEVDNFCWSVSFS